MIRAAIVVDDAGLLRELVVEGHAAYSLRGSDIVCAAASAIVRSAARVIDLDERFRASIQADEPGRFELRIEAVWPGSEEYLSGITNFLILGLSDISSDFPDRCSIDVRKGA